MGELAQMMLDTDNGNEGKSSSNSASSSLTSSNGFSASDSNGSSSSSSKDSAPNLAKTHNAAINAVGGDGIASVL